MKKLIYLLLAIIGFTSTGQVSAQCNQVADMTLLQQSGNTVTLVTNTVAPSGSGIYSWSIGTTSTIIGNSVQTLVLPPEPGYYVIQLFVEDSLDTNWCAIGYFTVLVGNNCDIQSAITAQNQADGEVSFISTASGGTMPYSYYWWFSDGQTATSANPTLTFANGFYSACLTVEDASGCMDSTCTTFNVTNGACPGDLLFIDANVNDNVATGIIQVNNFAFLPLDIIIDYGDGSVSTNIPLTSVYTFQHTYPASGSYSMCVIASNQVGCMDTVCTNIFIDECAGFQSVFTYNMLQDGYTYFSATSNGSGNIAYIWDFGDGTTGFGQGIDHMYDSTGVYQVCLTAVDSSNGCSTNTCQMITVQSPCQTLFNNPAVSISGFTATVSNFATGGCGSYIFESSIPEIGFASTSQTFQIDFTQAGSYQLLIVVYDNCGCAYTVVYPITISCGGSGTPGGNYAMQSGAVTTCNLNFTDPGGASANYSNDQDMVLTFYPASPGASIKAQFTQFVTETNFDYLYIHNGSSASDPLIATLNGSPSLTNLQYTSSAIDGALTFVWHSDFSVTAAGWQATITCTDLGIAVNDLGNGVMEFTAESQQSWDNYDWTVNGTSFGENSSTVTGTFEPGSYLNICVNVSNSNGCGNSACEWVMIPCNYNVEFDYTINGNEVEVVITNPDTNYFYSGMTGWGQTWAQFGENYTATFTFLQPESTQLCIYADGNCFDSTCVNIDMSTQATASLGGYVWVDANGNGLMDEAESGISDVYVMLCAGTDSVNCIYAITDENGFYSFDVFPGSYSLQAFPWLQNFVPTIPAEGNGYVFTINEGDEIMGFDFGYQDQSVTISGMVFYDNNNNGFQDAGEGPAAYKQVMIGNYAVYTNAQGMFSITLVAGTYNVSLNMNGVAGYAVTLPAGGTYVVNATSPGITYGGNVFGLWADPAYQDLEAYISPISTVTPGFPFMASLGYCNNGVAPSDGVFTYYWDPSLGISAASSFSPAPTEFNASENYASWNFSNLAAGDCDYIYMNPIMPVSLNIGDPIFNTVMVTPLNDALPANNIDTLHMTVVGSWDPNDKQGTPYGIGQDGRILPNTQLSYTIRFQNTGTAPAVNVVLVDTLTSELVLETFDMVSASHPYSVEVDNANRVIRWTFTNIMLPDSSSDPLGSIGYVNFRMNPVENQPDETVINNFADIYFDFNEPIRTNTTIHTIDRALGLNTVDDNSGIRVYPNPFKESTRFFFEGTLSGDLNLRITDMLGRTVDSFELNGVKFFDYEASHLSSGMYMYRISNGKTDISGKLIVR